MKDITKKELVKYFKDDNKGIYPLGFDEALLLIADYLDDKYIKLWINKFVDDVNRDFFNA